MAGRHPDHGPFRVEGLQGREPFRSEDFKAENKAAHEGITRRLDRLAEEVAFLRGRQDKDNEGD